MQRVIVHNHESLINNLGINIYQESLQKEGVKKYVWKDFFSVCNAVVRGVEAGSTTRKRRPHPSDTRIFTFLRFTIFNLLMSIAPTPLPCFKDPRGNFYQMRLSSLALQMSVSHSSFASAVDTESSSMAITVVGCSSSLLSTEEGCSSLEASVTEHSGKSRARTPFILGLGCLVEKQGGLKKGQQEGEELGGLVWVYISCGAYIFSQSPNFMS